MESENTPESAVERSKSSSDLSLNEPKIGACGTPQRSLSTNVLRKNVIKEPKPSSNTGKVKSSNSKSTFISVPDVNGNGDGNDNSQHRRTQNVSKNNHFSHQRAHAHPKINKEIDLCESTSEYSAKFDVKRNTRQKNSSLCCSSDSSSDKNSVNLNANEQKMKGEISFQLLNNLAYTLYTAPYENAVDSSGCNGAVNASFETKYFSTHQSLSPKDCFSEKTSVPHAKKTSKNGNGNTKAGSRCKQSSVCTLPKIKYETKTGKASKTLEHVKNLPSVKPPNIVFE